MADTELLKTENDKRQEAVNEAAKENLKKDDAPENQTASALAHGGRLPSDLEGLRYRTPSGRAHGGLTAAEAAVFAERYDALGDDVSAEDEDKILSELVEGRTVLHQQYVRVPAGTSSPLAADPDVAPPSVPYVAREDADPNAPNRDEPSSSFVVDASGERQGVEEGLARAEAVQKAQEAAHEAVASVSGSGTSDEDDEPSDVQE